MVISIYLRGVFFKGRFSCYSSKLCFVIRLFNMHAVLGEFTELYQDLPKFGGFWTPLITSKRPFTYFLQTPLSSEGPGLEYFQSGPSHIIHT